MKNNKQKKLVLECCVIFNHNEDNLLQITMYLRLDIVLTHITTHWW